MTNIAIFASGSGSNAQKIMEHFSCPARATYAADVSGGADAAGGPTVPVCAAGAAGGPAAQQTARVVLLLSDNPQAYALQRAARMGVPMAVFTRAEFASGEAPLAALREAEVDYIVLAGFLRLIPTAILDAYPDRVVNIHPALLPAYGGKGMYGARVHEAVIAAGERESGITIHRVNGRYDEGDIIAQFRCPVLHGDTPETSPADTPETLAEKIHALEHKHFSATIEQDIAGGVSAKL
ncbi:MAG: phosphoribosylglycinamide formyltransferase [Alistipes sp.]|nr:phosphoribosylglycinamide formyltransferase [Alistipes sp.]